MGKLTTLQLDLLKLRASGKTLRRCGILLGLSIGDVSKQFSDMLRQLNVWTSASAIVLAIQEGWIDASEIEIETRYEKP